MESILYLLLISFGAFLMVAIFQLSIYVQQKDKAFLYYSLYLFAMTAFAAVRILDARLTNIYPLSYHVIETIDPLLSNTAFLLYVNFLAVVLNITKAEKFYYKSWKTLQVFLITVLVVYIMLQLFEVGRGISKTLITFSCFLIIGFGTVLAFRLLRFIHETFFRLIISGTIIAVIGVLSGLLFNFFFYEDILDFGGLYFLLPGMMIETIFLSAALGYRLKLAYKEKQKAQQKLLEETKRNEQLALQAASLLQKELDIQKLQRRISKDLHDDVGASLSSIHIYSSVAKKLLDDQPEKAKEILGQISDNAHTVIENMSDIIWAMKADMEEASLSAKIKNCGYELLNGANIECNYQLDEKLDQLFNDVHIRRNIYLLIKEAFNNIAKYSNACEASLKLYKEEHELILEINDNGKGFDPCTAKKGNGVKNMKDRAKQLGGECTVESVIDKGTTIKCTFPMTIFSDTDTSTLL